MEQDDNKIVELVNKLMDADNLEKAPSGFTESVMSKIEALSDTQVTVYKPLIPRYIWWIIASVFTGLITYFTLRNSTNKEESSPLFNLPEISTDIFNNLSFDISNGFLYAMVIMVFMVGVQIPLIKQYFNKRLAY